MSHVLAVRLPDDLSTRLDRLAETTSRPKSFYVRTLLEEHISELEYVAGLDAEVESLRHGTTETVPTDSLIRDLGFDPAELRHEAQSQPDA